MVRRRTARLCSTVLGLLLAAPLLTACGGDHPGTAAEVGGRSISVAGLQGRVRQVRAAQRQAGPAEEAALIDATGDLDRSTLDAMVFDRVLADAVRDAGVAVAAADVRRVREAATRQAGGPARLRALLLSQYTVAPDQADGFFRTQAEVQALARRLGADLATRQGQARVGAALTRASRRLRIRVNPRYGRWDDATLSLGAEPEPWLRPVSQADQDAGQDAGPDAAAGPASDAAGPHG